MSQNTSQNRMKGERRWGKSLKAMVGPSGIEGGDAILGRGEPPEIRDHIQTKGAESVWKVGTSCEGSV